MNTLNCPAAAYDDADGTRSTSWDAENRPISIARVSGSELYAYDADGERIGRTAASPPPCYWAACGRRMWPVAWWPDAPSVASSGINAYNELGRKERL
jgi:YD repeat-containing protein